jgi:histidinol-phosphate phosphatase family protein
VGLGLIMRKVKAVFMDRDGVINEYPGDLKYVTAWSEFHFLPRVQEALKKLNDCGYKIFIISNQAGVSKGVYSQKNLDLITRNMLEDFKKYAIVISGVYCCTHRPEDNCSCRKPKTGLVDIAMNKFKAENLYVELSKSYFVGDTIRDIETGKAAGLKTILVFSGKEKPENINSWSSLPDFATQDLFEAVNIILK